MFLRPRLAGGTHTNKTNKSCHDSHRDAPTPGIKPGLINIERDQHLFF
nr:MAG TPA: hypothetical protein [Caudoviricetes sp.]